jgi:IS5 family transposase
MKKQSLEIKNGASSNLCDIIALLNTLISKRKATPMRKSIRQQLAIVQPHFDHEHARELQAMSDLLDEVPEIVGLVHEDMIRDLLDPEAGREGITAEQVLRALIIKQMNGFSYEELAFHLADSRSYRAFCRLGIGDGSPSKSALQRDIKKLRPETLEAINRILLGAAAEKGIEKGRKVRVDCTVVESNIHHPTDSTLLFDCVRVLCRLGQKAKEKFGVAVSDHSRRAKRRTMGILNAKNQKIRTKHYRDPVMSPRDEPLSDYSPTFRPVMSL